MRLSWATDVHLNFLDDRGIDAFCADILEDAPDGVLLGGDIAESPSLEPILARVESRLDRPIWFVLGNHDCYRGSIAGTRERARAISRRSRHLRYLPDAGLVELGGGSALVGIDGWGDGRAGAAARTRVMLNDHLHIEELTMRPDLFSRLRALGDEAAAEARRLLPPALAEHRRVVLLTHVPPFRESCWHEHKISDDDWLPHFTCVALGEALREIMSAAPDKELLVLCGHTHGEGTARILPNLTVETGAAEYGKPQVTKVLSV